MFSQIHNYGERRWFVKIETPFQKSGVFYLYLYLYTMKYKITDSQLESVIFLYIDNQDFIQIVKGNRIYFVNSESDEYAQIVYYKTHGWCVIYFDLIKEISSFFSLKNSDSSKIISKWVENITQMKVKDIQSAGKEIFGGVRIPSN